MEKKKKDFDAVAWVRSVRDEHDRKWGHLTADEYMRKIAEEAAKSDLEHKSRHKKG